MGRNIIYAYRESICNGDDDQKVRSLEYNENDMLSSFLKNQLSKYLPYTSAKTIWIVYMGSNEEQEFSLREDPSKKVAFVHMIENRCCKCEIIGKDRPFLSFGAAELYCAIYR